MRGCAGKTTRSSIRLRPSTIRASRSGRTFASRWIVATTYAPGSSPCSARICERSQILSQLGLEPGGYVIATIHREANVEPDRLSRIVEGLSRLSEQVLFPAHPRTRGRLGDVPPNVRLLEPLGYLDMAALSSQARVIVTDSGGLQKEAYWYGVPCVTTRPSTEWVDTVAVGANVLVDDDPARIAAAVASARMPEDRPPLYGDGAAAPRVAASLARRES